LAVLKYELRALCLLRRCSITGHSPVFVKQGLGIQVCINPYSLHVSDRRHKCEMKWKTIGKLKGTHTWWNKFIGLRSSSRCPLPGLKPHTLEITERDCPRGKSLFC
jgi:hypothetical protein